MGESPKHKNKMQNNRTHDMYRESKKKAPNGLKDIPKVRRLEITVVFDKKYNDVLIFNCQSQSGQREESEMFESGCMIASRSIKTTRTPFSLAKKLANYQSDVLIQTGPKSRNFSYLTCGLDHAINRHVLNKLIRGIENNEVDSKTKYIPWRK